jgi:phage terminase large subunit-like protein
LPEIEMTLEEAEKELAELERIKRVSECREDFQKFMTTYMSHHYGKKFGPAQLDLVGTLERMNNTGLRLCRAMPREFGKTSILTGFLLWNILYQKKRFIVYVCDAITQASLVIQTVGSEMDANDLIVGDFGDLRGKSKWGKFEILTQSKVRIMARGAKSRVRGLKSFQYRPDLVVVDDLENDKNSQTMELRDQLWNWLRKAVLNLLSAQGDVVVVGTIVHWDSIIQRLLKDDAWDSRKIKALDEDGHSTWPEGWPDERLERKRKEIGSEAFAQEFLNDPSDSATQPFRKNFIRWYSQADLYQDQANKVPKVMNRFIMIDPAFSGSKRSHWTAVVVLGVDPDNLWYVLDIFRAHASETELINVVFRMVGENDPQSVGIETVFFQKNLKYSIEQEMLKRNKFFNLVELKSGGIQKEMRIRGLVPRWETASILLPDFLPAGKVLADEILQFPKGQSDDILDALAYGTQLASVPSNLDELNFVDRQVFVQDRDPETGYISTAEMAMEGLPRIVPLILN